MKKAFYVFIFLSFFIGIDIAAHAEELDQVPEEPINFQIEEIQEDIFTFQPLLLSDISPQSDTTLTFGQFGYQAINGSGVISFNSIYKVVYCFVPAGVRIVATGSNNPMWFHSGELIQPGSSEPLVLITLPYVTTEAGYIYSVRPYSDSMSLNIEIDSSYVPPSDPPSGGGDVTVDVDLSEVVNGLETLNENILILTYIGNNVVVLLVLLIFVPKVKALGRRLVDNHNTHV